MSYTTTVTGTAAQPGEGTPPEYQTPPNPPIPDAPLPHPQPDSLSYELTVNFDAAGEIVDHTIAGHYHSSYYFALLDEPYGSNEDEEGNGDGGEDPENAPQGSSGTFTIILMSWTTLSFDSLGTGIGVGDQAYFSYNGGGSYQYDPFAPDPDDENGEGDEGPSIAGAVAGTFTESGLHISAVTTTGRILRDGTPDALTLMDVWFDQASFAYQGGGSYSDEETTGNIIENGSDTLIDDGSITLVLDGEDFDLTGFNTLTAFGHSFYSDSWDMPIDSEEDVATLLGDAWGSITVQDSYHDHFEFEIGLIEQSGEPAPEPPDPEDDEPPATHRWQFVSGTFDDFSEIVDKGGYQAEGAYSTTAGVGPGRDGETVPLNSPLSGTKTTSGKYRSSITYEASGTITPDEVIYDSGSLNLHDASDSLATLTASGPIGTSGLGGLITFDDHHETDYLRDITFDLTDPDLAATGHGHDYLLTDTRFDQVASGTILLEGMPGTQWANVKDHYFLEISVGYDWSDEPVATDSDGDGSDPPGGNDSDDQVLGWVTKNTDLTLVADGDFNIGYNVTGFMTRDELGGQSGEHAYQAGIDFTEMVIGSKHDADAVFSFTTIQSREDYFKSFHNLTGDYTSAPISPSGVIISGQAWEDATHESRTSLFTSFSTQLDQDPRHKRVFSIRSEDYFDSGHEGTGDYTRVDGDTTFSGSATHTESFLSENRLFVIYSLDDEGAWKLGPPGGPLDDYADSSAFSRLEINYDHSYQGTGTIDGDRGSIQWDPEESEASESGHAKYSLNLRTTGTPEQAPPEIEGDGGHGGEPGGDEGDGGADGDDSATASSLPELLWSYSGTFDSDSSFRSQFSRIAVGTYDSQTLSGPVSEAFSFTVTAGHEDHHEIEADGEFAQTEGENHASTVVRFSFDINLIGAIAADNPHSAGLSGTLKVENHSSGGFEYSRQDVFTPGPPQSSGQGNWTSEGESIDWAQAHASVGVDLAGTVEISIGGVAIPVEVTFETFTHSATTDFQHHQLDATSSEQQGPADDADAWLQIIGINLGRSVSRNKNTKFGTSDGGMVDEMTSSRSETNHWRQLLGPESVAGQGQWGEGGQATDDYDFSLLQNSSSSEPVSIPMTGGGGSLSGHSSRSSFQEMTLGTHEGRSFGDGPTPAGIDPALLDPAWLSYVSLPRLPEGAAVAAGPPEDDPEAQADWSSGTYGRMTISNSGGDSSGFELEGSYFVDAGAAAPALATHVINTDASSSYGFTLNSRLDSATGQWKNTSGSRSTSSSSENFDSFIVSGDWGSNGGGFTLAGQFLDSKISSYSNSSGSGGELDPQTGQWSSSNSYGYSNYQSTDRVVDGSGTYTHTRYGFPVLGIVTVNSEHHYVSDHSLLNITIDGVRSPESTGSRYELLETSSNLSLSGGGSDTRTETDSGKVYSWDGREIGTYTDSTTVAETVSEIALRDYSHSNRTDYVYDLVSGTLLPTLRVETNNHTESISASHINDHIATAKQNVSDRGYIEDINFSNHDRREYSNSHESTLAEIRTIHLQGPESGMTTVTAVGSATTSRAIDRLLDSDEYSWIGYVSDDLDFELYDHKSTVSTHDSVTAHTNPDGTGHTRYAGGRNINGPGTYYWWYRENMGELVWDMEARHPIQLDDRPPSYDETIPHQLEPDESSYIEPPEPFNYPSALQTPSLSHVGPGGFSAPPLPAGVSELEDEVSMAASSAIDSNGARDEYFTDLVTGSEQLGEDCEDGDIECESSSDSDTAASLASGYAASALQSGNASPNLGAIAAGADAEVAHERLPEVNSILAQVNASETTEKPGLIRRMWNWLTTPSQPPSLPDRPPRTRIDRGTLQAELGTRHLTPEQVEDGRQISQHPAELANTFVQMMPGVNLLDAGHTAATGTEFVTESGVSPGERILAGGAAALATMPFIGTLKNASRAAKGGFGSFTALKRALGPAGEGRHWHHIVEQSKTGQFGAEAIHNADNVISIPTPIHHKITGFYNSIQDFTNGQTVRQWLNGQSFEFQREFGTDILRRFGAL